MRLILAVVLLLTGTMIGINRANLLKSKEKQLDRYLDLLDYLQNNLLYRRLSTQELLKTAMQQPQFGSYRPLQQLLSHWQDDIPLAEAWTQALSASKLTLTPLQMQLLERLGSILGSGTAIEQHDAIAHLILLVQRHHDTAMEQLKTDANLYQTLGVFGGLFAAILVI